MFVKTPFKVVKSAEEKIIDNAVTALREDLYMGDKWYVPAEWK